MRIIKKRKREEAGTKWINPLKINVLREVGNRPKARIGP